MEQHEDDQRDRDDEVDEDQPGLRVLEKSSTADEDTSGLLGSQAADLGDQIGRDPVLGDVRRGARLARAIDVAGRRPANQDQDVGGSRSRIRAVASIPSMIGMLTSMRITSGQARWRGRRLRVHCRSQRRRSRPRRTASPGSSRRKAARRQRRERRSRSAGRRSFHKEEYEFSQLWCDL